MYLSSIKIRNFRCFGEDERVIHFNNGLTLLVGENDSGKSAILDAIRIVLGTTDQNWHRIELSDFHNEDMAKEISIVCKFEDLTEAEQAAFLECLSYDSGCDKDSKTDSLNEIKPCLYLHWNCKYLTNFTPPRTSVSINTGVNGDGQPPAADARELLRVTYLRALRDAYGDMQSGRNSRLSQIINSIENLNEGINEYSEGVQLSSLSITGIADLSNKLLAEHPKLKKVNQDVSDILQTKLLLKSDKLSTRLQVSGTNAPEKKILTSLLEKLDLTVDKKESSNPGRVGLGTSNVLSMACELLLNKSNNSSSFLLIEEPEAHIHAQRQLKVIQSLQNEANSLSHQIILTTHSPLLASVVSLENIIVVKNGKTYSMAKGQTMLDTDDYLFLERYLDATKANLFFAKSVLIVEGPAEELLLPTVAKLLGRNFIDYGVSLVNVRGTGLRRFARIFQRTDNKDLLDVKVACMTDRDIMPDCAPAICIDEVYVDKTKWPKIEKRKWRTESDFTITVEKDEKAEHIAAIKAKADGQYVQTFVSDHWTLEYDLAYSGLMDELIDALVAVKYVDKNRSAKADEIRTAINSLPTKEEKASYLYSYFYGDSTSKGECAQKLAMLLEKKYVGKPDEFKAKLPKYIIDAIEYVTM